MNWLITPIIGALIGYITNEIAVKMLFRPRKAIKIGAFTLPFTPGIIPKERDRLARTIGTVVSRDLLSKEALQEVFLSGTVKEKVSEHIALFVNSLKSDQRTIKETIQAIDTTYDIDQTTTQASTYISARIANACLEASIGKIIADLVVQAVKENFQGGFLSMMLNDSIIQPISDKIVKNIDSYIETNGEALISPLAEKEIYHLLDYKICDVVALLEEKDIDLNKYLLRFYDELMETQMGTILESIPFDSMIETQIQKMEIEELEALILSVMKKELRAIVNLGALIGFLLGLLNLFF